MKQEILYNFFKYGQITAYILIALNAVLNATSTDHLIARAINPLGGHVASWLIIIGYGIVIRLLIPKTDFFNDMTKSAIILFFLVAINEGLFQLFYLISNSSYITGAIINPTVIGIVGIIGFGILTKIYKYFNLKLMAIGIIIILIYFIIWFEINGFKVTVSLFPAQETAYYNDPLVNELELGHWLLGLTLLSFSFIQTSESK